MILAETKKTNGSDNSLKWQKGQVYFALLFFLVAIGIVIFIFTQIRRPESGPVSASLKSAITTAKTEEIASLKEKEGITIEGDLDVVNLYFGDFYTIKYDNIDKQFVIVVDDPSREAEARQKVAEWFTSKGVDDINSISIYWHIKP